MFEHDGVLYADEPSKDMSVVSARVVYDRCMLVTFSTGETRLFDITPLLGLPAFSRLSSPEVFSAFALDHGIITWCDGEVDIAPEAVYKYSYEYRKSA